MRAQRFIPEKHRKKYRDKYRDKYRKKRNTKNEISGGAAMSSANTEGRHQAALF
jgi:hypothetical protein